MFCPSAVPCTVHFPRLVTCFPHAVMAISPVLEPEDGIAAIGSGGNYALSAAKALLDVKNIKLEDKAKRAMKIAADICIYTNHNTVIKKIDF